MIIVITTSGGTTWSYIWTDSDLHFHRPKNSDVMSRWNEEMIMGLISPLCLLRFTWKRMVMYSFHAVSLVCTSAKYGADIFTRFRTSPLNMPNCLI